MNKLALVHLHIAAFLCLSSMSLAGLFLDPEATWTTTSGRVNSFVNERYRMTSSICVDSCYRALRHDGVTSGKVRRSPKSFRNDDDNDFHGNVTSRHLTLDQRGKTVVLQFFFFFFCLNNEPHCHEIHSILVPRGS